MEVDNLKSDTDDLDEGNDPDMVGAEIPLDESYFTMDSEPNVPHDGPVTPLIESKSDVELNSVALSSDQVRAYVIHVLYSSKTIAKLLHYYYFIA